MKYKENVPSGRSCDGFVVVGAAAILVQCTFHPACEFGTAVYVSLGGVLPGLKNVGVHPTK